MQDWPSILFLFRNEFDTFNNIGTRMLDSIYHSTLKLLNKLLFGLIRQILPSFAQLYNGRHYVTPLNL